MKTTFVLAVLLISLCYCSDVFRISIDSSRLHKAGERLDVNFSLTNLANRTVYLLNWDSPLSFGNYMSIKNKDTNDLIRYHGLIAKRGNPTLEEYISLKEGETISVAVNLLDSYPVYKSGRYEMQVSIKIRDYAFEDKLIPKSIHRFTPSHIVASNVVQFQLDGDFIPHVNESMKRSTYTHRKCTSTQVSVIGKAWLTFERMITNAIYFIGLRNTNEYRTFFGDFTESRYRRVKGVLESIGRLNTYSPAFDCAPTECKPSVFAYVYQTDRNKVIHLCEVFWRSHVGGQNRFDTQAGTIIHELSHFDALGNPGNDDIAYGERKLRELAISRPTDSTYNADSYEYFSEYTFE